MNNIINIDEYCENLKQKINEIIKDSTYSELRNYREMLPYKGSSEDKLFYWGTSFINEYYKIIGKLDKINTKESELLKHKIYVLYTIDNNVGIRPSYNEFITFSRLLNTTFSEYNPTKARKRDKNQYNSGNKEVDCIINYLSYNVYHSEHPHAYEINNLKLNILVDTICEKITKILHDEFDNIDLDDSNINNLLSEKRIKELKKKRELYEKEK